MDVQWVGGAFRATDAAKNTVRVGTDEWRETGDAPSPYEVLARERSESGADPDESVCGITRELRLPSASVHLRRMDSDEERRFEVNAAETTVPSGRHLLRLCTTPRIFVRFDGTARLERHGSETLAIGFPEPTAVSVVFRSRADETTGRIRIRPRVADVADAIELLAGANLRTTPDRTWPASRNRPPSIELGRSKSLPDEPCDERSDTGLVVAVPDRLAYLVTGASLIHYLGAEVRVGADTPRITADDWTYDLPALPDYQTAVNGLLRRVFFLDCLVRSAGPYGKRLAQAELLPEIGIDPETTYESPLADRVRQYLSAPFERVSDRLPDWHLAMYVEPTYDHVTALPHLLERLPAIYLPESQRLSKPEWIQLSLDQTSEAMTRVQREISNVELVKPELQPAQYHGWLAEDVPIDVFKTFPEAYDNRDDYIDDGPLSVVAVLNNAEMRTEHDAAVSHYRARAQELNLDVTVRENVRADQLASIFESRTDLAHFIGHRDERGLECADGFLSLANVAESNAQAFFLNACGSYHEGVELVRKGSVAGAVTFEAVTDKQAAEVGTAFARLLMDGYSIERALDRARQQVMTPKDYAVVGDGTHVLTGQSDNPIPPEIGLEETDDGYRLTYRQTNPRLIGAESNEAIQHADTCAHLASADRQYRLCPGELTEALEYVENAVRFDGALYWPEEFDSLPPA